MTGGETGPREAWGTRAGFILAAAGSAIGLGNIWRFPYIAGENGGAAFVLVYLGCVLILGIPIMLGELILGRFAQRNPVGAYRAARPKGIWPAVGGMGVLAGFLILSYYSVVGGWTIGYIVESVTGVFFQLKDSQAIADHFGQFVSSPVLGIGYHALFMAGCILVVLGGIKGGIERYARILMPALFAILLILIVRAVTLPGAGAGLAFFLKPNLGELSPRAFLDALGQAFFSLSLGMGALITYGSYLSKEHNLASSAFVVSIMDTGIAFMAGLAIFPIVFAMGLSPQQGAGLVFQTLPALFVQMPGGVVFGPLFFILLYIAAWTSGISLLEVVVSYFIDERGWSRRQAAVGIGSLIFLLGVPSALSFGPLADLHILRWTVFGFLDHFTAAYMLPLGGFLLAIFIGWVWGKQPAIAEAVQGNANFITRQIWIVILRYFAPFVVGQILLFGFLAEFMDPETTRWFKSLRDWTGVVDAVLAGGILLWAVVHLLRCRWGNSAVEVRDAVTRPGRE